VTETLSKVLQVKTALEISDVMDDYVHCFMAFIQALPAQTIASPSCQVAVSHTLAALMCPAPQTVLACLDTLSLLAKGMADRENGPQFAPTLQPIFAVHAKPLFAMLLDGVVSGYPEDGFDQVPFIIKATCASIPPAQAEAYATEGLAAIPGNVLPASEKQKFVTELHAYLADQSTDKHKTALVNLLRSARRARERGRQSRKSLGAV
jgi:transportin-3